MNTNAMTPALLNALARYVILAYHLYTVAGIQINRILNIDIDIGSINVLLQYIVQQYIDLYPCTVVRLKSMS